MQSDERKRVELLQKTTLLETDFRGAFLVYISQNQS